jgi:hypothetical protein
LSRRRRRAETGLPHRRLEVLPGGGRRFAHFKQAAVFYVILALTALLVLQAGYHWMGPFILARRLQVVAAEEGTMEQRIGVEGMLTRRELLLKAPCSGVIVELAPSGERAAAGTAAAVLAPLTPAELEKLQEEEETQAEYFWEKIKSYLARITGAQEEEDSERQLIVTGQLPPWLADRVNLLLPEAGLLLHQLDGWENVAGNPCLTAEEFAAASRDNFTAVEGLYVEEGRPILKLIDNWHWFYHMVLPLDPGRTVAARNTVLLEFSFAPGQPVSADLISAEIDNENEKVCLTYCVTQQFAGFEGLRWSSADLIIDRREGIIIPAGALVDREGVAGVFLNQGGKVKFNEVAIIRIMDDRAMVEGIEAGSMVIARPALVEEGQRLN